MSPSSGSRSAPWLLAIDTATSRIVVAAGTPDGALVRALDWPAGHRHGERLLRGVNELLAATGLDRGSIGGVVAGTGPGAFTGLRVGLATAKTLAHAGGRPIVGVSTGAALLRAAARAGSAGSGGSAGPGGGHLVLLLPAGPHDRVEVRADRPPRLLPGGTEPELDAGDALVAVDLEGRAPADACDRGAAALEGLAEALLELGAARLSAGDVDDPARLVPDYVTLPRGVRAASGEVMWSRDPR